MLDCIFCDIVKGKKPGHVVYKDKDTIAILDIFPIAPGHMMVIPVRHGVTILDYSKEELGKIWETVKKNIRVLEKTFNTNSFTIGINHGELMGVPHLHIHIIPRTGDDGGGIIQNIVKKKVSGSLEEIAEKIRKNI